MSVKAGGVDMPAKTDMHDWTTPSGKDPILIPKQLWKDAEKAGMDMRWYAVPWRIPTE